MRNIFLCKNIADIGEEDAVVGLGLVEKLEGGREHDSVEHVREQHQHGMEMVLLDQHAADVSLGMTGVGRGVGHNQCGAPSSSGLAASIACLIALAISESFFLRRVPLSFWYSAMISASCRR